MLTGICVFSYTGAVCVPYCAFTNICLGVLYAIDGSLKMNYAAYCSLMVILNVVLLPIMVGFFKYIVRPKVDYHVVEGLIKADELKMNKMQKIMAVYIVILCAMMILPNMLPNTWAITQVLTNLGVNGTFILIMVAMTLTYAASGDNLMDFAEGMIRGVPWGLYFLLLAALTISSFIASDATGIATLLVNIVKPLLAGRSAFVFMVLMVFIGCIITNCINNVVTITLLVPISMTFLVVNGGNPLLMASLFAIILLQGVVMPAGSVLGALLHGNEEWLTAGLVYKYAIFGRVRLGLCGRVCRRTDRAALVRLNKGSEESVWRLVGRFAPSSAGSEKSVAQRGSFAALVNKVKLS